MSFIPTETIRSSDPDKSEIIPFGWDPCSVSLFARHANWGIKLYYLQIHPAVAFLNICFDSILEICQRNENLRFLKQLAALLTCKLNTEKKASIWKTNYHDWWTGNHNSVPFGVQEEN